MSQQRLFKNVIINNRFLFSDYYLNELLPKSEDFKTNVDLENIFKEVSELYKKGENNFPKQTEGGMEKDFIHPLLDILGHVYEYQSPLATFEGSKLPDYAFFDSEEDKSIALQNKGSSEFWERAISVGDAKAWERKLDKKLNGVVILLTTKTQATKLTII